MTQEMRIRFKTREKKQSQSPEILGKDRAGISLTFVNLIWQTEIAALETAMRVSIQQMALYILSSCTLSSTSSTKPCFISQPFLVAVKSVFEVWITLRQLAMRVYGKGFFLRLARSSDYKLICTFLTIHYMPV